MGDGSLTVLPSLHLLTDPVIFLLFFGGQEAGGKEGKV